MSVSDKQKPSDTVSETNQHDALSVLRDLVALRPFMVADGFHEQARQLEAICCRARALVAEHPTNEETT